MKLRSIYDYGGPKSSKKFRPKKRILRECSDSISSFGPRESKEKETISGSSITKGITFNLEIVVGEDSGYSAGTILCADSICDGDLA